jgi:hypothetical protein
MQHCITAGSRHERAVGHDPNENTTKSARSTYPPRKPIDPRSHATPQARCRTARSTSPP